MWVTFAVHLGVIGSLAGIWFFNFKFQPIKAFLSSYLYLFFMLAGACWGLYPTLPPATTGAKLDITLRRPRRVDGIDHGTWPGTSDQRAESRRQDHT